MLMLSRQVNKTVNVVFAIESLGKIRSRKPNLTTREEIKIAKRITKAMFSSCYFFIYFLHCYFSITRMRRGNIRPCLEVAGHLSTSTTLTWGNPVKCLSQRQNKRTCRLTPHCLLNSDLQVGKL